MTGGPRVRSIGVAIAHPDPGVVDELVHAVEAASDLYLALDPAKASVVVAGASELRSFAAEPPAAGVAIVGLAVDGDLPEVARVALRCRAEDIVSWPRDRSALRASVREAASRARLAAGGLDGKIVAVVGARGGAGTSTIAAMIARSLSEAAVVDLDAAGGGQSIFVPPATAPTLESVLDVVDDLDPGGLRSALVEHAAGRALCAAPRRESPTRERVERLSALLRAAVPYAVLDLGRGAEAGTRTMLRAADTVLCVCAPDLRSMRGALALRHPGPAPRYVLNMATRLRVSERDVSRVLGGGPAAVVPLDTVVRKAGEAGRLASRGPARRAVDRLAASIAKESTDGR
jgi:Flp pilus assembly CpaE family ATPase